MKFETTQQSIQGMVLSDLKSLILLSSVVDDMRTMKGGVKAVRMFNCALEDYQVGQIMAVKDSYFTPNEDAPLFAKIIRTDVCEDERPSIRIFVKVVPHPLPYRHSL